MQVIQKNKFFLLILFLVVLIASVVIYRKISTQKPITEINSPLLDEKTSIVSTSGTVFFRCKADFDSINYGFVEVTPDLWLRAWTNCSFTKSDDSTQTITIPLWVENPKTNSLFISVSHTASSFNGEKGPTSLLQVKDFLAKNLNVGKFTGIMNVIVTSGKNSGDLLKENDPLGETLNSQVGEKMFNFASNLDTNILPEYSELKYPLVLVYRLEQYNNDD